jgi:3-methyl-2-oxobutanoate hydroxymethyltransferase
MAGGRERLLEDAMAVEEAGAFAVVLEGIPLDLAAEITERLSIPTIGIGAGVHCDGQVLVLHDLLGLFDRFAPKFSKRYVNLKEVVTGAVRRYVDEVQRSAFPTDAHSFHSPKIVERTVEAVEKVASSR